MNYPMAVVLDTFYGWLNLKKIFQLGKNSLEINSVHFKNNSSGFIDSKRTLTS